MNKLQRKQAGDKVLRRKNKEHGFPERQPIPVSRKKALMAGGDRVEERLDRKYFSKSKRGYGHNSPYARLFHLPKKDLIERDLLRADLEESP